MLFHPSPKVPGHNRDSEPAGSPAPGSTKDEPGLPSSSPLGSHEFGVTLSTTSCLALASRLSAQPPPGRVLSQEFGARDLRRNGCAWEGDWPPWWFDLRRARARSHSAFFLEGPPTPAALQKNSLDVLEVFLDFSTSSLLLFFYFFYSSSSLPG